MTILSLVGLVAVAIPLTYLYLLAVGAMRRLKSPPLHEPSHQFAIAIPAHDEETVIKDTIHCIKHLNYPHDLYDVYVVADHCTDRTAEIACRAGVLCYERHALPARSKGAALNWLLEHIWASGKLYNAVVFLDADTKPNMDFLRYMSAHLSAGELAIQGHAVISNPFDGWFPALNWAMQIIDERLQQAGRSNLGLSVRPSGWGFCAHTSVVRSNTWPTGLTEDYEFRLNILRRGVKIRYEPRAIVHTEAPASWRTAQHQRARWLAGTYHSSRHHLAHLLRQALRRRDLALLDAVAQMIFPSYSTLTVLSVAALLVQLAVNLIRDRLVPPTMLLLWTLVIGALVLYPFLGLMLERAPLRAYVVILTGPVFIVWRTWLAIVSRLSRRPVTWVPTARRANPAPSPGPGTQTSG